MVTSSELWHTPELLESAILLIPRENVFSIRMRADDDELNIDDVRSRESYTMVIFFFFMHFFFSGTKHPREDNPNLYYWAEMTGLHTQPFNI